MKLAAVTMLSTVCLLGIIIGIHADGYGMGSGGYGYGGGYSFVPVPYGGYGGGGSGGGFGNGGFLALIGLLFIIVFLFSGAFNTTSSTSGTNIVTVQG